MLELSVTGMTCQGCVRSVERVVGKVEGVDSVRVSLEEGRVTVAGNPDRSRVVEAIERAGFQVAS